MAVVGWKAALLLVPSVIVLVLLGFLPAPPSPPSPPRLSDVTFQACPSNSICLGNEHEHNGMTICDCFNQFTGSPIQQDRVKMWKASFSAKFTHHNVASDAFWHPPDCVFSSGTRHTCRARFVNGNIEVFHRSGCPLVVKTGQRIFPDLAHWDSCISGNDFVNFEETWVKINYTDPFPMYNLPEGQQTSNKVFLYHYYQNQSQELQHRLFAWNDKTVEEICGCTEGPCCGLPNTPNCNLACRYEGEFFPLWDAMQAALPLNELEQDPFVLIAPIGVPWMPMTLATGPNGYYVNPNQFITAPAADKQILMSTSPSYVSNGASGAGHAAAAGITLVKNPHNSSPIGQTSNFDWFALLGPEADAFGCGDFNLPEFTCLRHEARSSTQTFYNYSEAANASCAVRTNCTPAECPICALMPLVTIDFDFLDWHYETDKGNSGICCLPRGFTDAVTDPELCFPVQNPQDPVFEHNTAAVQFLFREPHKHLCVQSPSGQAKRHSPGTL